MKLIAFIIIITQSLSQFLSLITSCYHMPDHYFCNHGNKSLQPKTKEYLTFGWCCPNNTRKIQC